MNKRPGIWLFTLMVLALCHGSLKGFSQGENNNWLFGWHAGLTFNTVAATPMVGATEQIGVSPFSVSDSLGNLLFYSTGHVVFDRLNGIMPTGGNLVWGCNLTQPVFAVKKQGEDSVYYLFTLREPTVPLYQYGGFYSVVDMRLHGGLGDVVLSQKDIPLPGAETARDKLTGTRHANNRDTWIVTKDELNSQYLSYLISPSGTIPNPVLSSSSVQATATLHIGDMKISRDGIRLVANYGGGVVNYSSNCISEYCQFNPATGTVTPLFKFKPVLPAGFDCAPRFSEFSRNAKFLYIDANIAISVSPPLTVNGTFQYDATRTDSALFMQSQVFLGYGNNFGPRGLQLAADGKIYGALSSVDSLSIIHFPENPGLASGLQMNAISLAPGTNCWDGLPQFLQKYKAYIHKTGDCQSDSVHFSGDIWPPADSIRWNFGDPASGLANSSTLANPSHRYSLAGNYTVELYVRHNDNRTDTAWKTITIKTGPQPALGPDQTICAPQTATLDAGAWPGCTYHWGNLTTGQPNVGTGQTYTTGTAGTYMVTVTGPDGCAGKDTIQLFAGTPATVIATITSVTTTVCSVTPVTFTASGNPTGTSPSWQWKVNGVNTGTGGQVFTYTPSNGDCITCVLTSNALCVTGNPATSNQICMTVNQLNPVSLTISSTSAHTCAGTPVTFNAFPTNPGNNPVYQWKVNAINAINANNANFTYTPVNGDCITCELTSDISCPIGNPALSNLICMTVDQPLPVSVTVTTPQTTVCAGTLVTFTANPTHGGLLPAYQWKVNAINVINANNASYAYNAVNGDLVTCELTSSESCVSGNPAISPPVTMTVNPNFEVTVSITASSNPFCAGSQVTFTATPDHGGPLPAYQWKVNAGNVINANNASYAYNAVNGDVVTCELTSSESCVTGNPAISNAITMIVNTNLPAGVSISTPTNPFCPGTTVTITAAPANGGLTPVYQWKVNASNVINANNASYAYNAVNGDVVTCEMTSNLNCVTGNPAISNSIMLTERPAPVVSFTSCFDTITTISAKAIILKGGLPAGGQYSGPGVNSLTGIFKPSTAGTGLKTITYTYTNTYTCLASKSKSIMVVADPSFTCGNNFTDIRDNKFYPTVQIGSQCWMASNLDFGTQIPDGIPQTDNCTSEKYLRPTSYVPRPTFYQWDELMRYQTSPGAQGLCPPGWHIPSATEWNVLLNFYPGAGQAGGYLKDSLLVNGFHSYQQGFLYMNNTWAFTTGPDAGAMYWTSTSSGTDRAVARGLNIFNPSVSMYPSLRENAFPVRCLRD